MADTLLKRLVRRIPFYLDLYRLRLKRRERRAERRRLAEWESSGRPAPPPHLVKQKVLRRYAKQYGLRVLVETGTFMGDMVEAMRRHFDKIYSIELGDELYEKARLRFARHAHIKLIHGDSGVALADVMREIDRPALFWLDGHFSAGETARGAKDSPIYEELTHILNAPDLGHVIVIDDARCFGADPSYPAVEELAEFVNSKRPSAVTVEDDSIRIVPRR